jgi:hypothetical protein
MASPIGQAVTGTLHGRQLTLDAALPALEGRRVRVSIVPLDEREAALLAEAQQALWREWCERGPQGPIEPTFSLEPGLRALCRTRERVRRVAARLE